MLAPTTDNPKMQNPNKAVQKPKPCCVVETAVQERVEYKKCHRPAIICTCKLLANSVL